MKDKRPLAEQYGAGFVYFIQEESDGPIKIGRARNPSNRISSMATGNAHVLNPLILVPGEHREQLFHKYFSRCHLRNEWFRPQNYLLMHIEIMRKDTIEHMRLLGHRVPIVKPPNFGGLPIEEMKSKCRVGRQRNGDYAEAMKFFQDEESSYEGPGKHRLKDGSIVF